MKLTIPCKNDIWIDNYDAEVGIKGIIKYSGGNIIKFCGNYTGAEIMKHFFDEYGPMNWGFRLLKRNAL